MASTFLIFLSIASACEVQDSTTITLESATEETFESPLTGVVTLFGYHQQIADAPATQIATMPLEIDQLPMAFLFDLPADAHERIETGSPVAQEDAGFYYQVTLDTECPGWMVDNEPEFFAQEPPSEVALTFHSCR